MKFAKIAVAAVALAAVVGAQANVVGSLGGTTSSFLSLSSAGLNGGSVATLSGGSVLNTSIANVAAMPMATVGNYLSAEASDNVVLTFTNAVSYVSFLWGSPDSWNRLTVTDTNNVTYSFTAASLNLGSNEGYVQFMDTGALIKSLTYTNSPNTNAFETANYYAVSPVPEPGIYALMLGGLGMVGFIARRRRG